MTITDYFSGFSIIVAIAALYLTLKNNQSQSRLTDREVELVRIQIDQAKQSSNREKTASVSARLYKVDKSNWKLRVFNQGPSTAKNVRLILDDQNQIIKENIANSKFPMSKMENGQSVDLLAFIHMQSNPKEWIRIQWDDATQVNNENRVEITM